MKIQCDFCSAKEASVFCCPDEAALCDSCDFRVHHANKLASKHRRLSLLHPSSSSSPPPLCDICQKKRGFLFCQQDRAILCRDCDIPIHNANPLTMSHKRFLLTGFRLSSVEAPLPKASDSQVNKDHKLVSSQVPTTINDSCSGNSSISEYLIKTLPGWHVEDFLFDDAATSFSTIENVYCKADEVFPFGERSGHSAAAVVEGLPIWVPSNASGRQYLDWEASGKDLVSQKSKVGGKVSRHRSEDVFIVPQFHNELNYSCNKRLKPSSLY